MIWQPPQLDTNFEQRLARALDELAEDPRMLGTQVRSDDVTPSFVCKLIEEKLNVAAITAFDTTEASLRVGASEALLAAGHSVDAVRRLLTHEGEQFRLPARPKRWPLNDWAAAPWVFSSIAFAAWTLSALGFWIAYSFHPLLLPPLVLIGVLPSAFVRRWQQRHAREMMHRIASEYPPELYRHYVQLHEERTRAYVASVQRELQDGDTKQLSHTAA